MAKIHHDARRTYRLDCAPVAGEVRFQVVVEQTDLEIVAARDFSAEVADLVRLLRGQILAAGELYPGFLTSLAPVAVAPTAPEIVRRMARAGELLRVGPMAAVAGSIAQMVAEALADRSPDVLVENGGDLYLRSTRERVVGLLADPAAGVRLGLRLPVQAFPLSLCASSAHIGHSLSFGQGELVVVRARDAAVADAAATAGANILKRARDVSRFLEVVQGWRQLGVDGVFAQAHGRMAIWGEMELVAVE